MVRSRHRGADSGIAAPPGGGAITVVDGHACGNASMVAAIRERRARLFFLPSQMTDVTAPATESTNATATPVPNSPWRGAQRIPAVWRRAQQDIVSAPMTRTPRGHDSSGARIGVVPSPSFRCFATEYTLPTSSGRSCDHELHCLVRPRPRPREERPRTRDGRGRSPVGVPKLAVVLSPSTRQQRSGEDRRSGSGRTTRRVTA